MEDAFAGAVERAVGPTEMRQFNRKRVLRVGVLAAAALQDRLDLEAVARPLVEMDDWRARTEVVARVRAGDRVHRIRPQLAAPRGLGHRLADLLPHPDLIRANGHVDLESRHPGVLADR